MFRLRKEKQLDMAKHDFAKITAQLRKDNKQLVRAQKQFAKLVKQYPPKKENNTDKN